jgi:hypothetical protein
MYYYYYCSGDTIHNALIHLCATMQQVADAFGLGKCRGYKVTPSKAYGQGQWTRTRENVEVWLVGSNPDNRCFLKVDVNGRKCEVQIKRDLSLPRLMEEM